MKKVFIDGGSGTTGLRLRGRLRERKDIELVTAPEDARRSKDVRRELINGSDVAFLCLPDDAARESVAMCDNPDTVIIDTSTAHRTAEGWAYGFAELSPAFRQKIAENKRIAVPGCHASGFISIVYPLVAAGILPPDYPVVCYSLTGYSGGGKKMIADYENDYAEGLSAPGQYGILQNHKHLPEMQAVTGLSCPPVFTPIVADYYSGMATSVNLRADLLPGRQTPQTVYEALYSHYADAKLVYAYLFTADNARTIYADEMAGRDSMRIYVSGNDERIFITSVFDNLGKGASGAAIQCMNISMGVEETTGLVV